MERVNRLWARLYPVFHSSTTSHRLRADAFDLAVLMLCVRTTRSQNRHGHIRFASNLRSSDRLVSKLERNRKRAKRAWLGSAADKVYWDYQLRWHKLLLWIRVHLLFCRCNRTEPGSRARLERQNVKHCVALAREGLKKERVLPPSEKDLRRLVRLAMRYVRRGRAVVTLGSLLHGSPSGQRYLTKFVMERLSANHTTRNL